KFPEAYARAVAGRARIQLGELAGGAAELQAGLAIAREINSRYLELHAMVPWIDGLLALGRLTDAHEALASARTIATELKNTEHDLQLERLEAEAALQDALATDATLTTLAVVGERLAGWSTRLRGTARTGELAYALYLQALWALRCGDLPAGVTWTEEAAKLAEGKGLRLLVAKIAYVRAKLAAAACAVNSSVAGLVNAAVLGFADAGEAADELGDVRLDMLCRAGALSVQGLNSQLKVIARQLERLTEGLTPEQATAFMDHPDLREVMRALPLAGISGAARDVIGLMARFDEESDLKTLLKRAVASMVVFAGAERGFLLLFDAMDVTHKVVYGMTADEADAFSSSLAYQVLWTEAPLFVEDAQTDSFFSRQASVLALDLRSVVGVPLTGDLGTIGVLITDSRKITLGFGDAHLELLAALAKRVAGAIGTANTREVEARQQALDALEARVQAATAGAADLEAFMAPVAAEALALTDADRLCLVVGPELQTRVAFDRAGHVLPAAEQAPSQSAVRWVYEQAQALHLHDALTAEGFSGKQSVMALGLRTIHAVPVTHAGQVLGVLYLDDKRVGTEDPHVMEALKRLGTMVGARLSL
ncbi:MAG: two component, sigma54 specific, transcriptional regulator, Fis family, partial [Cyanobacteria bacterium RYN_339]|nr:two component, sigma54 specific, transcriptional regulator, Fis family [Cyanobacteria bacterium RYN_339]